MGSPPELSLECKPQGYSMGFALNNLCGPGSDSDHKLEDFHARLEEERLKIDAFKRELPLCMQLLTNALEASGQQLRTYKGSSKEMTRHGVVEELIPLSLSGSEASSDKARSLSDKTTWMTSAQLWSQSSDVITKQQSSLPLSSSSVDLALNNSVDKDMEEMKHNNGGGVVIDHQTAREKETGNNSSSSNTNQSHRKARRCWSPDLHRRFVNALQMLGGSQVATPKQIRELMKVDGLTNDEVKSHLQKYRLHTRRPSPNPQGAGQLVVLGGIWVPQEYGHQSGNQTLYHHGGSAHYCAPPPQMQLHHLYNKATSHANSSAGGESKGLRALRQDGEESNGSDITLKF